MATTQLAESVDILGPALVLVVAARVPVAALEVLVELVGVLLFRVLEVRLEQEAEELDLERVDPPRLQDLEVHCRRSQNQTCHPRVCTFRIAAGQSWGLILVALSANSSVFLHVEYYLVHSIWAHNLLETLFLEIVSLF